METKQQRRESRLANHVEYIDNNEYIEYIESIYVN
jgi:hypothetical protein